MSWVALFTTTHDKNPSVWFVHNQKKLKIEIGNCQVTNGKSYTFLTKKNHQGPRYECTWDPKSIIIGNNPTNKKKTKKNLKSKSAVSWDVFILIKN